LLGIFYEQTYAIENMKINFFKYKSTVLSKIWEAWNYFLSFFFFAPGMQWKIFNQYHNDKNQLRVEKMKLWRFIQSSAALALLFLYLQTYLFVPSHRGVEWECKANKLIHIMKFRFSILAEMKQNKKFIESVKNQSFMSL